MEVAVNRKFRDESPWEIAVPVAVCFGGDR